MQCDLCAQVCQSAAIKINNAHICHSCEAKILSLKVWDLDYPEWINKMKILWQHFLGEKGYI